MASIAVQGVLDFEVKVADCIASLLNVRRTWTAIDWKEKHCKSNNNPGRGVKQKIC